LIPYVESQKVAWIYKYCEIIERNDIDEGTEIIIRVPTEQEDYFASHYKNYIQE
jgi:hypothetical protein